MYLGIEIGGTKLQLGAGSDGALREIIRRDIDPDAGADGILEQIAAAAPGLIARHQPAAIGIGFGGPVNHAAGTVIKSHHVRGWTDFPISRWCQDRFGLPVALGNDADVAALAEAHYGAGRGMTPVLYMTVGTGIGGGLVLDGNIYRGFGQAAMEIGHLRPGTLAREPHAILESLSAGWGIEARARAQLLAQHGDRPSAASLAAVTARHVAEWSGELPWARQVWEEALTALGWAVAQCITLLSPQVVVIGGGVSLAGDERFFTPLRALVAEYVFPPLLGSAGIVPAQLGEEVVVHGAIALAQSAQPTHDDP